MASSTSPQASKQRGHKDSCYDFAKKSKDKGTALMTLDDLIYTALEMTKLFHIHGFIHLHDPFISPFRHGNGSPNRILSLYNKEGSSEERWRLLGVMGEINPGKLL